ncbi:alternative ribosome rescue aminoacyl-tRNA hydrolase ArfB [Desulfobacterales bacterium HSG17]|nr:alternative ribosome rescue aminoacyl-tRNA hydrolase ArfB [Desulfobacterales bacterium HSG17]
MQTDNQPTIVIPKAELEFKAVHASGPGGQNVNKVSTAVQLRFNIQTSSLPAVYKDRILAFKDKRITSDGKIIIKAKNFRSQEKNKMEALFRLQSLIQRAIFQNKKRRPTKPSKAFLNKLKEHKIRHSRQKQTRRKIW